MGIDALLEVAWNVAVWIGKVLLIVAFLTPVILAFQAILGLYTGLQTVAATVMAIDFNAIGAPDFYHFPLMEDSTLFLDVGSVLVLFAQWSVAYLVIRVTYGLYVRVYEAIA